MKHQIELNNQRMRLHSPYSTSQKHQRNRSKSVHDDLKELMSPKNQEEKGLIPRILDYIHNNHQPVIKKLKIKISYLEIYNDHIIDLLEEQQPPVLDPVILQTPRNPRNRSLSTSQVNRAHSQTKFRQVKENQMKGVYIQGLREEDSHSIVDSYNILLRGLQKKKVFSTVKNSQSSRSHTIF
jgi:kinesin family protein 20/centromeric protein E